MQTLQGFCLSDLLSLWELISLMISKEKKKNKYVRCASVPMVTD